MGEAVSALDIIARSPEASVATHIRGTMLASSIATVRERDMEKAYFAALPQPLHAAMREVVPQAWAPMHLAVAHYHAMHAVFPTVAEQIANGRFASVRTQNSYVLTIVRALRATATVDVVDALRRVPSVIARMVQGGSCIVYKCGPKDGRIELCGFAFLEARYSHNAWQGMFESSLGLLARRIKQDLAYGRPDRMALQVSWV